MIFWEISLNFLCDFSLGIGVNDLYENIFVKFYLFCLFMNNLIGDSNFIVCFFILCLFEDLFYLS